MAIHSKTLDPNSMPRSEAIPPKKYNFLWKNAIAIHSNKNKIVLNISKKTY
jgi:hypothetical protein